MAIESLTVAMKNNITNLNLLNTIFVLILILLIGFITSEMLSKKEFILEQKYYTYQLPDKLTLLEWKDKNRSLILKYTSGVETFSRVVGFTLLLIPALIFHGKSIAQLFIVICAVVFFVLIFQIDESIIGGDPQCEQCEPILLVYLLVVVSFSIIAVVWRIIEYILYKKKNKSL